MTPAMYLKTFSVVVVLSMMPPLLASEDNTAMTLNNEGVKSLNAGDTKTAIQKFEAAVKEDPSYNLARENLGIAHNNYALTVTKQDLQEAITNFHAALFYSPNNKTTRENLESAIRAAGKDPNSFRDRLALADKALKENDFMGAKVEYEAALALKNDLAVRNKLTVLSTQILPDGRPLMPVVTDKDVHLDTHPQVDWGPYMANLQRRIRRLYKLPPAEETRQLVLNTFGSDPRFASRSSHVPIPRVTFKIHKDGIISDLKVHPCGLPAADDALIKAVKDAAPFGPLPAGARDGEDIQIEMNSCPVFRGSGNFRRF
jgi:tetratricopeptide (TPR) repeat protein